MMSTMKSTETLLTAKLRMSPGVHPLNPNVARFQSMNCLLAMVPTEQPNAHRGGCRTEVALFGSALKEDDSPYAKQLAPSPAEGHKKAGAWSLVFASNCLTYLHK